MANSTKIYPFKRVPEMIKASPEPSARKQLRAIKSQQVLSFLAMGVAAFLFSRGVLLGGLYPFGIAFLAATEVIYPKKGALALIPVLLGLYTVLELSYFFVYSAMAILLTVVFLVYPVDSKKQWVVVPVMIVAAMLVSKGLLLAFTVFTDYQLMISIFESLISAGLSLIFLVILSAFRRFDVSRHFSLDETICIFIAVMGLLCGVNGWQIGPIDVQSLFSRFLIMTVAFLGGGGAGAAVGAMVGIIPSLSHVIPPATVATYAFSGLLAGIFGSFGRIGAAIGFILGNMILALYILDAGEISASLLASAVAALLFLLLNKKMLKKLKRAFVISGLKSASEEKNERLLQLAVRKLRNSGWTFRELASSLNDVSEKEEIREEDNIRACMEQLSHQLCSGCSLKDICWELDYHQTFTGIVSMFEQVKLTGMVTLRDTPENFTKRCPHVKELVAVVNCLYDLYRRTNFWQMQRISSRDLISTQLTGVAESLDKIAKEITDFGDEREILERELQMAMVKRGMPVESAGITAISSKAVDIWVQYIECPGELYCRQAVADEVSRLLGVDFRIHENTCSDKDCQFRCTYRLLAAGAYKITVGKAQLSKDGKGVCGDSGGSVLLDEGRQLLMISDGMGQGDKAAKESNEAVELVSRLLEAGFRQDTAIDVVNAALSLRGDEESFVTLDICVVDLYSGMADFIKSGGAASYIKRGGMALTIKGSTLPVGMLYSVDKDVISEQLVPGDMVILASDGLLDMDLDQEGQWLSRVIGQAVAKDPQALAEYLLDKVVCVSNGKIKDDITVLVAQVGEPA